MREIALYLESLAKGIHSMIVKADNKSTTTLCYNIQNRTLYIASQGDKPAIRNIAFNGSDTWVAKAKSAKSHKAIRKYAATATYGGYKKLSAEGYINDTSSHESLLSSIKSEISNACDELSERDRLSAAEKKRLKAGREAAEYLSKNRAPESLQPDYIKWVTRFDFICGDTLQSTGIHGEAYLTRFLAIKMHRIQELPGKGVVVNPILSGVDTKSEALESYSDIEDNSTRGSRGRSSVSESVVDKVSEIFKTQYRGCLAMASSQGACSSCADMMKDLGIEYASKQSRKTIRDDTWLNPFSLTTRNHSYVPATSSSLWLSTKIRKVNENVSNKLEGRRDQRRKRREAGS